MAHFFPANSRLDVERAPSLGRRTQSRPALRETADDASSASSDSRTTRPSHINWLQNSLATTHAGPSTPRRPPSVRLGRSASLSALAGPPPALHRQPSLISNHSLQLDRSRTDNPGAASARPTIKPLSPISERSYIPTPKREQHVGFGDVEPSTPVSAGSSYSAFLRRPLKRSISATSSSSLRTNATSTHPPILPPLNLPPLDIRAAYPPVSHRAGQQLVSTVYEDAGSERTASFVTALGDSPDEDEDDAEDTVEAPYSHGPSDATFLSSSSSDPLADPDQAVEGTTLTPTLPGGSSSSGGGGSSSGYGSGSSSNNNSGTNDSGGGGGGSGGGGGGGGGSSSSGAIPPVRPRPRPRRRAPATSGGSGSTSDTFIWRRWTRELSFGSGLSRPSFSAARRALASRLPPLPVLLFWAGFLAPWCWLIGGWLIAEGRWEDSGKARAALPLWKGKSRRPKPRGATAAEKQKRRGGAGGGGGAGGDGGSQRFPADSLGKDLEKGETAREREREGQARTGEEEEAAASAMAAAEAAEVAGARSGKEDEAGPPPPPPPPPPAGSGRARRVLWIPFASYSRRGAATAAAGVAGLGRPSPDAEKVVTLVKPYSAEVWVYRCRLAAVVSAIVLFTALIVALVVIGRPKS